MKAVVRVSSLRGIASVPGSKSHTIRGVVIGTLTEGETIIRKPLYSEDTLSAVRACKLYGAEIELKQDHWVIRGVGRNLKVPDDVVNVGNSGTTIYFMTGVAGLLEGWSVLTGDYQIRRRPIEELLTALRSLGATAFRTRENVDAPPVVVRGIMKGGKAQLDGKFSQFLSSLLIATPLVNGKTCIEVRDPKEKPYIKMTLEWLKRTGIRLNYDPELKFFEVEGPQDFKPVDFLIPSDWSSLSFFIVAAVVTSSEIRFENVDLSFTQADSVLLDILMGMGADLKVNFSDNSILVGGGRDLRAFEVDCSNSPDLFPILTVLGCFAKGESSIRGLDTIRFKETDRVAVMIEELSKMGARIGLREGVLFINGAGGLRGSEVNSHGDHRIAMALTVAGLFADGETTVNDVDCVSVSFPNFFTLMTDLGANVKVE
ncbi:MAG: 3-phosphoshikimate 1-carboxyvinyltransferase [Synergistetes bacterium]|nr:3-phosphoshikimate 1-carboxyvinyltransferase [Synergistota bacterium]MCX8127901.1 3-phosphoshikimate 1-carboxyvinyltransferase [Synergistota bacterium]MDW8192163.1 3-phosphoshikimate 1-carboxyvinyltransferase [Synergistota bacterium]